MKATHTLAALVSLAVAAQAQVFILPSVISTPDGVVAGFTEQQVVWTPIALEMRSDTSGPWGFSGPIIATQVRNGDGDVINLWPWYSVSCNLGNIEEPTTLHWDYITDAYPQGELTVSYYHVPEPSTYALLAGLGLVVFAAVRRSQGA